MVAVVKGRQNDDDLTLMKIMPYWWTHAYWKEQIPEIEVVKDVVTMDVLKASDIMPDHDFMYCPNWAAPNKKGRPKKGSCIKSSVEKAMAPQKKRVKNKATRGLFCAFCEMHGHIAQDCPCHRDEGKEGAV